MIHKLGFLDGGGEMGALTRNYDWEKTELGKPESWPHSLKTTIGIILHSAFPMFLFWGKDLLCFYNDAYRPSLGNNGKHPLIGTGGKDGWPEIWYFIGPLIEKVLTTGDAVLFEDQYLPIFRNGKMEDVYWTFSYSPAYDDDGKIGGVFVTCTETTEKIVALSVANETANQLQFAIDAADLGTWELNPMTYKFRGNTRLKEWFGLAPEEEIELTLATNVIAEKDRAKVNEAITRALTYESGGHYDIEYTIQNPVTGKEIIVKAKGKAYFDEQKKPYTFNGTLQDVTQESRIKKQVEEDFAEQNRIYKQVEESEARLKTMIDQTPAPTLVLMGDELVVEQINEPMLKMLGRNEGVIGIPLIVTMPELKGQYVWEQVQKVYNEGVSFDQSEVLVPHKRTGVIQDYYYNISYRPLKENGNIIGMIQVAIDVTEQVFARQKTEESEAHLQLLRDTVPAMIFYADADQRYRSYNDAFMKWFNVNATEALGKTIKEFLGEVAYRNALPYLDKAYAGEKVEYHMHAPQRMEGEKWLNIVYTPHKNTEGKVIGIIVHATDMTEHMRSLQKIEESENRFRNLLQEAPVAATLFRGIELTIEIANELTLKYWGKDKNIIGKPLAEAAPELEDQQMVALVRSVYESGGMLSFSETPIRFIEDGVLKDGFYSFSLKALYDSNGNVESILSIGTDVTEQVIVRKQIEESEARFRTMAEGSDILIAVGDDSSNATYFNTAWSKLTGRPMDDLLKFGWVDLVHPNDKERYVNIYLDAFKIQGPFTGEFRVLTPKGDYRWLLAHGTARFDANSVFLGYISSCMDVTQQVEARKTIEFKEKELRELITASPIGICVVSGNPARVEEVNNRFLIISGKTRAQYANAPYWEVLSEVAHIFEPILADVFKTGIKYTTEENEMVLVRDGIPERISITFEYIPVFDSENKVSKVIVMAIEVTHQVETRKKIEEAVVKRTKELGESNLQLKRSNEELEQFAYIASHDLQEPIRKISTFTQLLEYSLTDLSKNSKDYISKIYNSTDRMTKLIRDVLAFSRVKDEASGFEKVDLNKIIDTLKTDFELQIEQSGAIIETFNLPEIEAIPTQMIQLFSNLMSNSLKYKRPDLNPVIKISASNAKAEKIAKRMVLDKDKRYYHIEFSDNGIGFEKDQVDRIFRIFQRLHGKNEFEGTGIGLAICLRIVQNHQGHISAAVGNNEGAVFNILLPY